MRKIEIIKDVYSSVLGFGCAPILGAVSGKVAERAINIAIDCGINHFDLARSYGYGEAESFLGKVLKGKRNEVVIATKFGIKANWKSSLLKPLKPIVRYVKGHPSIKERKNNESGNNLKIKADKFHDRLPITESIMVSSLEKSLKCLKTDYVDILFVHEPLNSIKDIELILLCADKLKRDGKIKGIGLACMQDQMYLHNLYLNQFDILQFNNSPGMISYEEIKTQRSNFYNIMFSPLNGGNSDLSPSEKLLKLTNDFPESVILCSMFNEKHIKTNSLIF